MQWVDIANRDHWECQNCGAEAGFYGTPQLAHKIANTKYFRLKYGNEVIDHPLNRVLTCSLACNSAMNLGHSTARADELRDTIMREIHGPDAIIEGLDDAEVP